MSSAVQQRTRTGHARSGIVSFAISIGAAAILAILVLLLLLLTLMNIDPPGDEVAYGFMVFMLVLAIALSEIVALVLGVVGVLQRRRKRSFAVLGIACSVLAFAVVYIGWFTR
jgi:hypothetical protein